MQASTTTAAEVRMHTRRYAALLAIAAVAAVPIAGCGGDDDDDAGSGAAGGGYGAAGGAAQATTTTSGGEKVDMSLTDFALDPADPTVNAGTVTFDVANDGQTTHALEVEGPGEEVETDDLSPGGTAKLTVDLNEPGTYEMYCPVGNHREMGMEGQITVK
jgi:uncharacterized cupredoxin-like copper-binding protein